MPRDRVLWTGVLLPPMAWAVNLCVNYFLSSVACTGAWPLAVHIVSVVTMAAIVYGGLVSWRAWPGGHEPDNAPQVGRAQFMAAGGVSFALIFGLTVLAQWYPAFVIEPCRV